jgi:type II secretory pathway pseudopilin PulG
LITAGCLLLAVAAAAVEPLWQQQQQQQSGTQQQQQEKQEQQQLEADYTSTRDNSSNGNNAVEEQHLLLASRTHPDRSAQHSTGYVDADPGNLGNNGTGPGALHSSNVHGCSSSNSSSSSSSSLSNVLRTKEFWLIFYVFAVGVGAGLAFTNNLPEIVAALAAEAPAGSNTVTDGVSNIGGRFASLSLRSLQASTAAVFDVTDGFEVASGAAAAAKVGRMLGHLTLATPKAAATAAAAAAVQGSGLSVAEVTVQLVSLFSIGSCFGR